MHWWFPENASSYGSEIDRLFLIILYITGIVFVLTEAALLWFLFKYRRREGVKATYVEGNTRAEIIWTAIPAVICVLLGLFSQPLWSRIKEPENFPADAITYGVTAKQFEWHFTYPGPDGKLDTPDDFEKRNELHLVVNKNIKFRMQSLDVIHSFYIPQFRLRQDVVPGMTITAWVKPTRTGEFEVACSQLCGLGHYRMRSRVIVQTQEEFDRWQQAQSAPPPTASDSTRHRARSHA
jgi:cytochrome c oxidase subunit 2